MHRLQHLHNSLLRTRMYHTRVPHAAPYPTPVPPSCTPRVSFAQYSVGGPHFPEDSEGLDAFRRAGGAVVMSNGPRPNPFSAFDVVTRHGWVGLSSLSSSSNP